MSQDSEGALRSKLRQDEIQTKLTELLFKSTWRMRHPRLRTFADGGIGLLLFTGMLFFVLSWIPMDSDNTSLGFVAIFGSLVLFLAAVLVLAAMSPWLLYFFDQPLTATCWLILAFLGVPWVASISSQWYYHHTTPVVAPQSTLDLVEATQQGYFVRLPKELEQATELTVSKSIRRSKRNPRSGHTSTWHVRYSASPLLFVKTEPNQQRVSRLLLVSNSEHQSEECLQEHFVGRAEVNQRHVENYKSLLADVFKPLNVVPPDDPIFLRFIDLEATRIRLTWEWFVASLVLTTLWGAVAICGDSSHSHLQI